MTGPINRSIYRYEIWVDGMDRPMYSNVVGFTDALCRIKLESSLTLIVPLAKVRIWDTGRQV